MITCFIRRTTIALIACGYALGPWNLSVNGEVPRNDSSQTAENAKPTQEELAQQARDERSRQAARLRGELTFDDLKFDIEKDEIFEDDMLTEEVKELDKKTIRIRGYILPTSVFHPRGFERFVLVRDNQECCFGPGAALYDAIMVEMEPGKTADFTTRVVTVSGKFSIDTESYKYPDGTHYAVFKLVASQVR